MQNKRGKVGEPLVPLSIDINNPEERTVYNLIEIKRFHSLLHRNINSQMMNSYLIKMAFIVDCIQDFFAQLDSRVEVFSSNLFSLLMTFRYFFFSFDWSFTFFLIKFQLSFFFFSRVFVWQWRGCVFFCSITSISNFLWWSP